MKKTDFNDIIKKYQPVMQKTGEKLSQALKIAEKDISKVYNLTQKHISIQLKNLQKEKIYHELGKYVAKKLISNDLDISSLDIYKERIMKIEKENENLKKELKKQDKSNKKKITNAKKKKPTKDKKTK